MHISLGELAARMGGVTNHPDVVVTHVATDSREVRPGSLFLCIRGARVDGHDFWSGAQSNGAVAALCEREVDGQSVRVNDITDALSKLGASFRDEYQGTVIGVTGSNGKTTTKELIAALAAGAGKVRKSPGNKNTEYTSPLVWLDDQDAPITLVELSMRGRGQIEHLRRIHRPQIAVITGIGTAHIEMLGSREGIAEAKAEILPETNLAILPRDDDFFEELKAASPGDVITFGDHVESNFRIVGYRADGWKGSEIRLQTPSGTLDLHVPNPGRHNARNVAAAVAVAHHLGVPLNQMASLLTSTEWPPMRLEIQQYLGRRIIVDTYNASPDSMAAAIRTLDEAADGSPTFAILGEMKELGTFTESGHRRVGEALSASAIERALLIGEPAAYIRDEAIRRGMPEGNIEFSAPVDLDLIRDFIRRTPEGSTVLMKASRALGLDQALES